MTKRTPCAGTSADTPQANAAHPHRPAFWKPALWPAPHGVHAGQSLRHSGVSLPPYDELNLGLHVGDDPQAVVVNRARLHSALQLPSAPYWLEQVHGTHVITINTPPKPDHTPPQADAIITQSPGIVCAVLTADCLPLLLCNRQGTEVAAVHAGWRGLAAGILKKTVETMHSPASELMAWLGCGIGPDAFEVGEAVRDAFQAQHAAASTAFHTHEGRLYGNLSALARMQLQACGVDAVHGGSGCTVKDTRFFSYRRDGGTTGRMASLIWY